MKTALTKPEWRDGRLRCGLNLRLLDIGLRLATASLLVLDELEVRTALLWCLRLFGTESSRLVTFDWSIEVVSVRCVAYHCVCCLSVTIVAQGWKLGNGLLGGGAKRI